VRARSLQGSSRFPEASCQDPLLKAGCPHPAEVQAAKVSTLPRDLVRYDRSSRREEAGGRKFEVLKKIQD
jgi:hypothetical protein